jgi:hypothetical protein
MYRYGFITGLNEQNYRVGIYLPTTIFEGKGVQVKINNYRTGRKVDELYVRINKMPRWDIPTQAVLLGKKDQSKLEQKINAALKALP